MHPRRMTGLMVCMVLRLGQVLLGRVLMASTAPTVEYLQLLLCLHTSSRCSEQHEHAQHILELWYSCCTVGCLLESELLTLFCEETWA